MASFHEIISGSARGIGPAIARGGLRALSWGYTAGIGVRNKLFDLGWKSQTRVDRPVISVGNLTCGGTGKTPVVGWLANWLGNQGLKPAILSRGYRSLNGEENDEKRVLDLLCPGVPHVQNPDRIAGAKSIADEVDLFILDDGFQHRRLARDLDIVLIDANCPWGYGSVLPRGLLRESRRSLRRADVVLLTRCDQITPAERMSLRNEISRWCDAPLVESQFTPQRLRAVDGTQAPLPGHGSQIAAFCGIGNPRGFRNTLKQLGYRIEEFHAFPDHHHYSERDLESIVASLSRPVLTTLKDLVKVPEPVADRVAAVEIGFEITNGWPDWIASLNSFEPSFAKAA